MRIEVVSICAEKTSNSTTCSATARWRSACRPIIRCVRFGRWWTRRCGPGRPFRGDLSGDGRKSIPPERLLRALLLQMLYSIRSERMLMEQLEYNLLFRWFVGLSMDDPVWHPTVFTKNRDRLLDGEIAEEFFRVVLNQARRKRLLSDEHFTVDGTLIEAWAGQKSFQLKDDDDILMPPPPADPGSNPTINYRKQKRSNETHESMTDPLCVCSRRPRARKRSWLSGAYAYGESQWVGGGYASDAGHGNGRARCGNRDGGRDSGGRKRVTLGADRAYDTRILWGRCASSRLLRTWRRTHQPAQCDR